MEPQHYPDDLKVEILKRVMKYTAEDLEGREREEDWKRAEDLLDQI